MKRLIKKTNFNYHKIVLDNACDIYKKSLFLIDNVPNISRDEAFRIVWNYYKIKSR